MKTALILAASALAAVTLATAAAQVTLLSLDLPDERTVLLVRRTPGMDMRLVESETSLCARQRPGSPLHSAVLPATFCPLALPGSPALAGDRVLLRLPVGPPWQGAAD